MMTFASRIVHMKEKMKCTFCDHVDSQKWRMMEHIRVNHFGEVLYPCKLCNFHADGKRKLESHMKNAHPNSSEAVKTEVLIQDLDEGHVLEEHQPPNN